MATDLEKRDAAVKELKQTLLGYKVAPHSPRWNRAMALLASIGVEEPEPAPIVRGVVSFAGLVVAHSGPIPLPIPSSADPLLPLRGGA